METNLTILDNETKTIDELNYTFMKLQLFSLGIAKFRGSKVNGFFVAPGEDPDTLMIAFMTDQGTYLQKIEVVF